jgi:ketosteroid isomerase-like protein
MNRLDVLEASNAIRELAPRYADAYAKLDADALVELYVPDVPLHSGERGYAALRAHFERAIRGQVPGAGLATVILHTENHIIDVTGPDVASGIVYCHVEVHRRDGSSYQQAVVYTDSYARLDGGWYFAAQRRHDLLYGAASLTRPNRLPAANWPASQTGRGSLPDDWPSWHEFWRRAVTNPNEAELRDDAALRELPVRYARAVDRRDRAALAELFAPGALVVVPGTVTRDGRPNEIDDPTALIDSLSRFSRTRHDILRQDLAAGADMATGETFGEAHHFHERRGELRDYQMTLRYRDTFVRTEHGWRFSRRELHVDRATDVAATHHDTREEPA